METGLGAGIDLITHIHLRCRILSNQNDRQPGSHSLRGEFVSPLFESRSQLCPSVTVHYFCRHDMLQKECAVADASPKTKPDSQAIGLFFWQTEGFLFMQ